MYECMLHQDGTCVLYYKAESVDSVHFVPFRFGSFCLLFDFDRKIVSRHVTSYLVDNNNISGFRAEDKQQGARISQHTALRIFHMIIIALQRATGGIYRIYACTDVWSLRLYECTESTLMRMYGPTGAP